MMNTVKQLCCACVLSAPLAAGLAVAGDNLLQNPGFEFHAFVNHREGKAVSYTGNTVAFWRHGDYGDITVTRESQVAAEKRPSYSVHNLVSIRPGKSSGSSFRCRWPVWRMETRSSWRSPAGSRRPALCKCPSSC